MRHASTDWGMKYGQAVDCWLGLGVGLGGPRGLGRGRHKRRTAPVRTSGMEKARAQKTHPMDRVRPTLDRWI